jgi:acetyl-CoA acetyltransferase family protein
MKPQNTGVALIASARTPFLNTATAYSPLMSYELAAYAIEGVMQRCPRAIDDLGLVVLGTVLHEIKTTNVAREAMLKAGLSSRIPAYTVAMAGISPNVGVSNICDMIRLGRLKVGLAGGTDNFSDVPIRLSQPVRRSAMKLRNQHNISGYWDAVKSLRLKDLALDIPKSEDYTTKLTMGQSCEAMGVRFGISRLACDEYTLRGQRNATEAIRQGLFAEQIVTVTVDQQQINQDQPPRISTLDQLSSLKPVFDPAGVITAGNASKFSDGAGALLLADVDYARQHDLEIQALIVDYQWSGVDDLNHEMLLGPAMTIPALLQRNQLQFSDIDVWEIHEAFAAQVLINRSCMADAEFVHSRFGSEYPFGEIPLDKLNLWGGSLSLGNPFAATGIRLIQTAAQRLKHEGGRYAIVATCAGGGLGAAYLIENIDQ